MASNLVIVESPAKAKTIEGYLGKDFIVKSSYGHVRDLPKGNNAIDIEHGFKPQYEILKDKKEVVAELKKLAKASDIVWLATDDDREGEAISWHLHAALELDDKNTRRIVFREITKNAILNAISSPRGIDYDLVNAQQARRILDRLVGFELSPILWKKIKRGLSAGRVQSVAVRIIVEREREIEKFNSSFTYKVTAQFLLDKGKKLVAELSSKFKTAEEAEAFLKKCIGAQFTINTIEKKPYKRSPAPSFTTSTLQQEASRKLNFSVAQTMTVAQKLYESGKISYMRTDSVNLSEDAIANAKKEIERTYGEQFFKYRKYKNKNESAQEAHEAIRPTDFAAEEVSSDRNEQRLYDLIRKRAKASLMADAEIEKTVATIGISSTTETLVATGEVVKFEGFLKAYEESFDDDENEEGGSAMLPPISVGEILNLAELKAQQRFSKPSARYTEAALVKKLEEMGIGRPSTYAPTISTIQKRDYVLKENRDGKTRDFKEMILKKDKIEIATKTENYGAEKAKLFPTDMGMIVTDFLVDYFPNVVDYSFTATVEKDFDEIAHGKLEWETMIDTFYGAFHKKVENTETNVSRTDVGTSREIGIHPTTNEKMLVKLGKYGPYVQIGEAEGDIKPKYASLKRGQLMETLTLEDALELFKLPREVGIFEEKPMVAAIGKFGPYIKHDSKFYSIPKGEDPLDIVEDRSIEIIVNKRQADAEKLIKEFPENLDVKILNGRFGPYITVGKKNVKIPKDKEPKELTLEECITLADATPDKPAGKRSFGKKK